MIFLTAFLLLYFGVAFAFQRSSVIRGFLTGLEREVLALSTTCLLATFLPPLGISVSNPRTGNVTVSDRLLYEALVVSLGVLMVGLIIFCTRKFLAKKN
jgi:hypothetical protein